MTTRIRKTAGIAAAAVVSASLFAAPAHAQAPKITTFTVDNNSTGCQVWHAENGRVAVCADLHAEMQPIPNSGGLLGVPTVSIVNQHVGNAYRTEGWGSPVDPLGPGQFRQWDGLTFVADFNNGMHVFDGVRYVGYVGNGKAIANPNPVEMSSTALSSR